MSYATAFVSHPDCARHDTGWNHPEHQGRLPALVRAVYRETPVLLEHVLQVEATPVDETALLRVHTPAHLARIRDAVAVATAKGSVVALDPDTKVSDASWDAALAAAGCVTTAVGLALDGDVRTGFAAARPPGHHATADRAMGFCLFNNVAVAARDAQAQGIGPVLIVDWDVHHGNGTQDIFYEDPSVYYLSAHLGNHYPGTGAEAETGAGPGLGTTRNVTFRPGTTAADYRERFDEALDEALDVFRPELVLVSAGFDCLAGDPLGGLRLEPADLHSMTRRLMEAADATAEGRLVVALEGGYAPDRLGQGAVAVLRALADLPPA